MLFQGLGFQKVNIPPGRHRGRRVERVGCQTAATRILTANPPDAKRKAGAWPTDRARFALSGSGRTRSQEFRHEVSKPARRPRRAGTPPPSPAPPSGGVAGLVERRAEPEARRAGFDVRRHRVRRDAADRQDRRWPSAAPRATPSRPRARSSPPGTPSRRRRRRPARRKPRSASRRPAGDEAERLGAGMTCGFVFGVTMRSPPASAPPRPRPR